MQANKLGSNPLIDNVIRQVVSSSKTTFSEKEILETLLKRLEFQGIKSVTYRFPVEEISEFDQMVLELQKALGGKRVNKNDLVRTGVNYLIEDWQKKNKRGLVFRLFQKRVNNK